MWVLHLRMGFHLKLPKSPMGYIKTNLNMGIVFRVSYSYNFAPTHILIFTNYKFDHSFLNKIWNKTQKKVCLLSFSNISKLSSFTFFRKI
jgi:hypothetical protein